MLIKQAKTLTEWLLATKDSHNQIDAAIAEWLLDSDLSDDAKGIKDAIHQLESTSCSSCNAPAGLIYTSDLMDKLALWKVEIIKSLNEYYDATGESYKTDEPANFVWFAVEWRAQEMANEMRGFFKPDYCEE